jgi:hypothetical protein
MRAKRHQPRKVSRGVTFFSAETGKTTLLAGFTTWPSRFPNPAKPFANTAKRFRRSRE